MRPILTISLPSLPSFDMIFVEGGEFSMGSDKRSNEQPIHNVKVGDFYIGKHQMTQRLWQAVMKNNPSRFKGDNRPVENVSWQDTHKFIKALYLIARKTDNYYYHLPTEAEWEFAARGGIYSQGYTYAGSDKLKQVGWYNENNDKKPHEVGQLRSNELDLYDMSGNVWEWCEDDYHDYYSGAPIDGSAWIDGFDRSVNRVLRGGSYFNNAGNCRSAYRRRGSPDYRDNDHGFRLCLSLQ